MSESDPSAASTRVAVDVLRENQRDLLFRGAPDRRPPFPALTEPFDGRRRVINWWQAASVRTFGYVRDVIPASDLLRDDQLINALVGPDDESDEWLRHRLLEALLEATERAHQDLEVRADEWLGRTRESGEDESYQSINPAEQQHIAMRPAFSRLDRQQAHALRRLWAGFDSRDELAEWQHGLPGVADFSDLDEPLPRLLARSAHCREMLLESSQEAARYRERFAAGILLPAFATRAQRLRAGEKKRREPDSNPWNKPKQVNHE
jgi:hypothetical protein